MCFDFEKQMFDYYIYIFNTNVVLIFIPIFSGHETNKLNIIEVIFVISLFSE